jgi:hypothetical protein
MHISGFFVRRMNGKVCWFNLRSVDLPFLFVMNADFLAVLEFWEREKGINRDVLVGAVQEALLSAAKKAVGPARELRVEIDQKNGDIKAFAKLIVSEKVISKHDQISVFDARRIKPDAQVGDEIEKEVTPTGFGRIASQYAKQALMQKIRQAEKALIFTEFKDRVGDIVSGTVRRFERSDVILDLGKYEALLPNRERVPTEEYQVGERIRCYVKAVRKARTGRKSFCPAPIRASSSSCSSSKFPKSTTARLKSRASRANRVSAPRWRSIRATRKWIRSARASACAASA